MQCDKSDHWLIKRFLEGGKVITSTTETMAPKKDTKITSETVATNNDIDVKSKKEAPEVVTSEINQEIDEFLDEGRVCNSCVGSEALP